MNRPAKDFSLKDPAGPDFVRSAGTDCVRLVATGFVRFAATDFSSTDQRYSIADAGNPFQIRFPLIAPILWSNNRSTELQICAASKNLVARNKFWVACQPERRKPTAGKPICVYEDKNKGAFGEEGRHLNNGRVQSAPAVSPRVGAEKTIAQDRESNYRADAVFAGNSSLIDFADTVDAGSKTF